MVRAWVGVGSLCLFFYDLGISMFRPSMVLNQRQVSLVVSDWESYLGIVCIVCIQSSVLSLIKKSSWTHTMLHFGPLLTTIVTLNLPARIFNGKKFGDSAKVVLMSYDSDLVGTLCAEPCKETWNASSSKLVKRCWVLFYIYLSTKNKGNT